MKIADEDRWAMHSCDDKTGVLEDEQCSETNKKDKYFCISN